MKCPNCNETLLMTNREGVEIDYCPTCRGVWLDKGELDKLIERSSNFSEPPSQQPYAGDSYKQSHHPHHDPYYKHKKKKGFLGDFFDFD